METVQRGVLGFLRVSFMIAGHIFSHCKGDASSDVFSTDELANTMSTFATTTVDHGSMAKAWRTTLLQKYFKLCEIRELPDFMFAYKWASNKKGRQFCYSGSVRNSSMKLLPGHQPDLIAVPPSYLELGQIQSLR